MQLNNEQAKHIADTLRIAAVAEFGFFGYTGRFEQRAWLLVFLAIIIFALTESAAVLILKERT